MRLDHTQQESEYQNQTWCDQKKSEISHLNAFPVQNQTNQKNTFYAVAAHWYTTIMDYQQGWNF